MDQDRSERIRQYEIGYLVAELAYLESTASGPVYAAPTRNVTPPIRNLQDRPHVVRLIETRFFGAVISFIQHFIWALRHRAPGLWRLRRVFVRQAVLPPAAAPQIPSPSRKAPPVHELTDVAYDKAILLRRPKILIDVTPSWQIPAAGGGIPRLVREMARAAVETGVALPVYVEGGTLFSYYRHPALNGPIETDADDIYVIVDIFWYYLATYEPMLAALRQRGTRVALILHDIFPLRFPSFSPAEVPPTFERGLREILGVADFCLPISQSTVDDVRAYLAEIEFARLQTIKFAVYHPGVSRHDNAQGEIRRKVSSLFTHGRFFLGVGTLEPRKGYSIALDGCELAWAGGADFSYVILGRHGWRSLALKQRILGHAEFGKRLFWIQDANDHELRFAYMGCRSLLQCSIAEGFGLPLIEAAEFGAPIIASDLAVFREVGGDEITFFPVGNAAGLAAAILACLASPRRAARIAFSTWPNRLRELPALLADA